MKKRALILLITLILVISILSIAYIKQTKTEKFNQDEFYLGKATEYISQCDPENWGPGCDKLVEYYQKAADATNSHAVKSELLLEKTKLLIRKNQLSEAELTLKIIESIAPSNKYLCEKQLLEAFILIKQEQISSAIQKYKLASKTCPPEKQDYINQKLEQFSEY